MSTSLNLINYRAGDIVREHDGKHLAIVRWTDGVHTKVRWQNTGWKSTLPAKDLLLVERARTTTIGSHVDTVVESPKRALQRYFQQRRNQ